MTDDFVKTWEQKRGNISSSLFEELFPRPPMRERITHTIFKLNSIQKRLEDSSARMKSKDKTLFQKCVKAQKAKDTYSSTMYANEIAQLRNMANIIVNSQIAMEQVILRLETVRDFGDISMEILPVAKIMRTIKNSLSGVIPEISYMLGDGCCTLDELVMDVGQVTSSNYHTVTSGDAEKILAEASAVAEQKMKDSFPSLPSTSLSESGLDLHK